MVVVGAFSPSDCSCWFYFIFFFFLVCSLFGGFSRFVQVAFVVVVVAAVAFEALEKTFFCYKGLAYTTLAHTLTYTYNEGATESVMRGREKECPCCFY